MKVSRLLLSAAALTVLSACAAERKPPPSAPAPAPRPAPAPQPAPAPPPADWRDAPVTPGNWSYRAEAGGSSALFGPPQGDALFALRCDRAARSVMLRRAGSANASVPLSVTTTSTTRAFTAAPQAGDMPAIAVAVGARDPILDALAFSRGRFMVEVPGLPTLYLPAWPEVGRVVEDCR